MPGKLRGCTPLKPRGDSCDGSRCSWPRSGCCSCCLHLAAPPQPVQAWYMYGTTLSGLESAAYSHACSFATNHPGGTRLLNLDFGAARQIDADTWGALDFSGVRFTNASILEAMKAAADGHHNCYTGVGSTIVAYGNSNYHMTGAGMTTTDAW